MRELARPTGESQTAAVTIAVQERLDRLQAVGRRSWPTAFSPSGRTPPPPQGALPLRWAWRVARRRARSAAVIVDTSALIAILRDEPEARSLRRPSRRRRNQRSPRRTGWRRIARAAYRDFGRSSGHPAGLNFGDCFAYALAKDTGEPLLFKGRDFVYTDVVPALDLFLRVNGRCIGTVELLQRSRERAWLRAGQPTVYS